MPRRGCNLRVYASRESVMLSGVIDISINNDRAIRDKA